MVVKSGRLLKWIQWPNIHWSNVQRPNIQWPNICPKWPLDSCKEFQTLFILKVRLRLVKLVRGN